MVKSKTNGYLFQGFIIAEFIMAAGGTPTGMFQGEMPAAGNSGLYGSVGSGVRLHSQVQPGMEWTSRTDKENQARQHTCGPYHGIVHDGGPDRGPCHGPDWNHGACERNHVCPPHHVRVSGSGDEWTALKSGRGRVTGGEGASRGHATYLARWLHVVRFAADGGKHSCDETLRVCSRRARFQPRKRTTQHEHCLPAQVARLELRT